MEILTKLIIPISTFLLGIVFTLALKKYEQKKSSLRQHAAETSKLLNEWYNQLHKISVALKDEKNSQDAESQVRFYVKNRLVLPQLILSLEVLKTHKSSQPLVASVENFLTLVTTYRPDEPDLCPSCPYARLADTRDGKIRNRQEKYKQLDALLLELDHCLYEYNRKAAKLLK